MALWRLGKGRAHTAQDVSDGIPHAIGDPDEDETPAVRSVPVPRNGAREPLRSHAVDVEHPTPAEGVTLTPMAIRMQAKAVVAEIERQRVASAARAEVAHAAPPGSPPSGLGRVQQVLSVVGASAGLCVLLFGGYKLVLDRPTAADVAGQIEAHAEHPHPGRDEALAAVRARADDAAAANRARIEAAELQVGILTKMYESTQADITEIKADVKRLLTERR